MLKHHDNGTAIVHHLLKYYKYSLKLHNNKIIIRYLFNWVLMQLVDDEAESSGSGPF